MASACDGLKVVDFGWGIAGGLSTMVLADFGAEVIKVEPPSGDPFRGWPGSLMVNRGKKSVILDLKTPEGLNAARRLAAGADVVVESFRPGVADRLGIGYADLAALRPELVYCSITGFGQHGPLKHYKGYEAVVAARSGRMLVFEGLTGRRGPAFSAVQTATHATSQAAVQAILAALLARDRTGRGRWVQTSLLQGLSAYDIRDLIVRQMSRRDPVQFPPELLGNLMRLPTLQYLPARTKDGRWIQIANLIEHLFHAWIQAIDLWEIYEDPRFMTAPQLTEENRELLRDILLRRMQEKTLDEWMQIFIENGDVGAEPFLTTQEGMNHPQVVHNRHVIEIEDPRVGKMKQLGVVADLTETPGRVQSPAPDLGQHTREVLAGLPPGLPPVAGPPPAGLPRLDGRPMRHALEGITVLEFATVIAGPFSTVLLADLGARVIKVEALEGDSSRQIMGGTRGTGAVKMTQGKESICLNLKTPEGQEAVHKLIAGADVLIHNYRPGVPERLGIGYETASKINPRLVYIYLGAYGATGAHSRRPGFHPIPGAVMGGAVLQAGRGAPPPPDKELTWDELKEVSRRLGRANETNPDPNTSMVIATAALLGLYARRATGRGQWIQTTMLGANAYVNADDFFSYEGKPPRPELDEDCRGIGATYRLYEAREGWVFLACVFDEEWQAFCRATERSDLLEDSRFCTAESRQAHDAELVAVLSDLFCQRTAGEWEALLTPHDVACVRADAQSLGAFYEESDQCWENGFIAEVDHLRFGPYWRHSALAHFSDMPGRHGAGVIAGQHTRQILRELGYKPDQIEDFKRREVVNWEDP